MELKFFISRNNFDGVGKFFLKKGFDFFYEDEISKSFEFIKMGLETLTCDCSIGNWRIENKTIKNYYSFSNDINSSEYFFCKAVILSYNEDKKSLYVALDAIDSYLKQWKDSLGLYIKGKILTSLEQYLEAKKNFEDSIEIDFSERTLYRLGRLKEMFLGESGIDELYTAYLQNPFSACSCRVLKEHFMKTEIEPVFKEVDEDNILISSFIDKNDPWILQKEFERLLENNFVGPLNNLVRSQSIIGSFIYFITRNQDTFIGSDNEDPDFENLDEASNCDELNYDEMYFDTMTDGQLGSYDDFMDGGGDLDSIDDWSGK